MIEEEHGPDVESLIRPILTGKSILLLEDEMIFATRMIEALNHVGVELVQFVQRGEVAAREGSQREYDILLFDRDNPGQDGLEALRAIRASGTGSHRAPALIVTGAARWNSEIQRSFGLLTGADDYVNKSVGTTEILARIVNCLSNADLQQRLTAGPAAAPTREVRNGPLLIKKLERNVYYGAQGTLVSNLLTQSFDILLAMSDPPGRPFTKAMLYEVINPHWKGQAPPTGHEQVIQRAVYRLRIALEPFEETLPPALQPLILTLRSQGYVMRDMRDRAAPDHAL